MTLIKSILLGSAAGIVAVASAQAADLPTRKAAPVADYVKICNINGTAGFIVPGSDTCLKLFGDVKFETIFASVATGYTPGVTATALPGGRFILNPTQTSVGTATRDSFEMGGRADIGFTATSNTAYGPLIAEAQFEGNHSSSGSIPGTFGGGPGASNFALDHAFLKWAGITAGYVGNFYDLGNGNGDLDYFSPDPGTHPAIAYTAAFGGGFSATIFAQDGVANRSNGTFNTVQAATNPSGTVTPIATSFTNTYHGAQYPDFGAVVDFVQGWGGAHLAAMAHNNDIIAGPFNNAGIPYGGTNNWGWGVNGLVSVNLPSLGPKSEFTIQGAYSHGALSLGGATAPGVIPFNGNGASFPLYDSVQTAGGGWAIPSSWSVASHLLFAFNPQFSIEPQVAYASINYGNNVAFISNSVTAWMGGVVAHWDPVTNLDFQLDLIYVDSHEAVPTSFIPTLAVPKWQTQSNGFFGRLAIARTF